MNRTFGIEIEGFGISLSQARDALCNAGLDCQVETSVSAPCPPGK